MAFHNSSVVTPFGPTNENWKSQGFLNFYLPDKNGEPRKLGSIGLKESKPNEAKLMAYLKEDPSRVDNLLSKLQVVFRPAEQDEEASFDLE
jgi:hypothetical protein